MADKKIVALILALSFISTALYAEESNESWSFGQSLERGESIWKKGVGAAEIKQKALPNKNSNIVDTRKGIDKAVNNAIKNPPSRSLGLSMEKEDSHWRSDPAANNPHIDENMARDRKRVFRAYADVRGGEDWNITVGPELILKDDQYGEASANSSEPDSALGLGMKFHYDF